MLISPTNKRSFLSTHVHPLSPRTCDLFGPLMCTVQHITDPSSFRWRRCMITDTCLAVQDTLQELSRNLGVDLRISGYVRLQCGEGMVTQKTDFASEVAAMAA